MSSHLGKYDFTEQGTKHARKIQKEAGDEKIRTFQAGMRAKSIQNTCTQSQKY